MYYVYFLTNKNKTVLYTGFTGNLIERIAQHKSQEVEGFTKKYNLDRLVYYEQFENVQDAKAREKAVKKWNRQWKEDLINASNPEWNEVLVM
ncbi:MAG: GIY-YIG nuclease family protein [Alphaproteobacteria bacterium]|nr:GIY-YIG nuclease family protein [Alphaproteobacteria bacterium]